MDFTKVVRLSPVPAGTPAQFITFEGGEGGGKSTHLAWIAEQLRKQGVEVLTTREPGGTPQGEALRTLLVQGAVDGWKPVSEALLHAAARHEHVERVIRPALAAGTWVLCDRFVDSTLVYQGAAHGLPENRLESLCHWVTGGLMPSLTFVFDLPVEVGLARSGVRLANEDSGEDRMERLGTGFHRKVREGFLNRAKADPFRCRVIDASGSLQEVAFLLEGALGAHLSALSP